MAKADAVTETRVTLTLNEDETKKLLALLDAVNWGSDDSAFFEHLSDVITLETGISAEASDVFDDDPTASLMVQRDEDL